MSRSPFVPSFRALALCAALFALAGTASASDACDNCDLAAIWDEYLSASQSSVQKAAEAAALLGDAAAEYQAALDVAQDLGSGLLPPDPRDPMSWCGKIGDVVGKFQDAMNVLGAFGSLWQGSANEQKAKELMESSAWYWKEAQRSLACWKKCCEAARQAKPALVSENPTIDFQGPGLDEGHLRECLVKLSVNELKSLRSAADSGQLATWMHSESIEMIKRIVSKEGAIASH